MHRRLVAAGLTIGCSFALAPSALAAAPHVKNQLIVKYADSASSAERAAIAKRAGLRQRIGRVNANGADVVSVAGDAAAAVKRLNAEAGVLYAEIDYVMTALELPNDPLFPQLYGMNQANDKDIDAPEGWDRAGTIAGTVGLKVGIVDTGIDRNHVDIGSARVVNCAATTPGFLGIVGGNPNPSESRGCADDHDHGTHVAGTIGAIANNNEGVAGVSPNAQFGICKALHGALGSGSTTGVANCITYLAQRGNKIISMSLGGPASTTLQTAVTNATNAGSLLIAAAGNNGDATLNYPAAYAQVVSVAALDANDNRASFSNANADVELAAAGVNVLSTKRGGGYIAFSGTSMATPHVAGVASVVGGELGLTGTALRNRLNLTADDVTAYGAGRDTSTGFGRVNLNRALGG
ncbi:MAG: S8 family serine peptidase [Solirubrobacteraceae bacterium]